MSISYSRVDCFNKCKMKYYLRYIANVDTLPDDTADNALYLGTALHEGIEHDSSEYGVQNYFKNFNVCDEKHLTESYKLAIMIDKAREVIPNGQFEYKLDVDGFVGFIDLLVPVGDGTFDIYDFKYSSNEERYKESAQLHLYKYYFEKQTGLHIRKLIYVIVPKCSFRLKKGEELYQLRKRADEACNTASVKLVEVEYNRDKVSQFLSEAKMMETYQGAWERQDSQMCRLCEYNQFCKQGETYMLIPKNEKRNIEKTTKKVIWIYGAPFSGKTTFANKFPDPLMLNTDGNIKFVDAPFVPIKDVVTQTGRVVTRKFGWEVFKEAIAELEVKSNNTFKTLVLDLVEDTYELCRLYMYNKLGIEHESDDAFRAWDKVRTEFLSTMKKFVGLDYENIVLISHVDMSKDLSKRSGDKVSKIMPNLADKVANKIAGMVDIVGRCIAEDGEYTLDFKRSEVIFGGGRLVMSKSTIPLTYEDFNALYDESNATITPHKVEDRQIAPQRVESPVEANTAPQNSVSDDFKPFPEAINPIVENAPEEIPAEEVLDKIPTPTPQPTEPVVRQRRRRD